jgi:quinol monooxygenase YgiN
MGLISFAAFRPKPGRENDLAAVITDRLALMRRLGFVTDRPAINMRAKDGTFIQVSEWVSQAAIDQAHKSPEVLALWGRYADCADHVMPSSLAEIKDHFPCFECLGT